MRGLVEDHLAPLPDSQRRAEAALLADMLPGLGGDEREAEGLAEGPEVSGVASSSGQDRIASISSSVSSMAISEPGEAGASPPTKEPAGAGGGEGCGGQSGAVALMVAILRAAFDAAPVAPCVLADDAHFMDPLRRAFLLSNMCVRAFKGARLTTLPPSLLSRPPCPA